MHINLWVQFLTDIASILLEIDMRASYDYVCKNNIFISKLQLVVATNLCILDISKNRKHNVIFTIKDNHIH